MLYSDEKEHHKKGDDIMEEEDEGGDDMTTEKTDRTYSEAIEENFLEDDESSQE
jgi:hypothetical protein